ncbi:MAG: histidine utilization repressor [Proteobacteria bacterium]|nr:histidine utilization repressor [Pseudomonadota bacterium]
MKARRSATPAPPRTNAGRVRPSASARLPGSRASGALAPFERVKHYLLRRLTEGVWPPGALMPSEAELVREFGVSRMTVNRALRELQNEGLVDRVQGVGTFAAPLHRVSSTFTIRDIHEEIVGRGHRHHATVHLAREEAATAAVAQRLGVAPGARVFHTLIVHYENDVALQCEDRYVNPRCAPDYLSADFTQTTPTHYLLEVAPLLSAHFSVQAGLPAAREAKLLGLKTTDPCLIVDRRTSNRDGVITQARLVHPAGRYQIEGAFQP